MGILKTLVKYLFAPLFILSIIGIVVSSAVYFYYLPQIPSVTELRNTQLQLPIQVYSKDDQLIAEFGQFKRRPVTIEEVPKHLHDAFIAIEDARYYQHKGVDFKGILRAIIVAAKSGSISQGASTITMQVARNFYLNRERTLDRKLREALLALKIEEELSKKEILELYLNKIFLGKRAYGVGSAAEIYYGKTVDELSLAQSAMIAGLPKAPSRYNPIKNPKRAKIRRDYILQRMFELRYIDEDAYQQALNEPLTSAVHKVAAETYAPYMAEMARTDAIRRFGEENIYKLGLKIYTTLDSAAQEHAIKTLRANLLKYTKRHGFFGAEDRIQLANYPSPQALQEKLADYKIIGEQYPAVVTHTTKTTATFAIFKQDKEVSLPLKSMRWARKYINENRRGKRPKSITDILSTGDIVRLAKDAKGKWQLSQIPKASSALVSLNPEDGAIEAIAGGFDFTHSKFNRAIQARRQPGSSFKPFVYSAALDKNFSPASVIDDAPIEIPNSDWDPQNYTNEFNGLTRLRVALAKSMNLVSIHLLQEIGVGHAIRYAERFGFSRKNMPRDLTLSLGTGSATPLDMATAYATFANGGYKINPYYIRKIMDKNDNIIFEADPVTVCAACDPANPVFNANTARAKRINHPARRIIEPHIHYQIHSMMNDVTLVGTAARAARILQRQDLAGKTGTTNDQRDAWFVGYTNNNVTSVWVGFDSYKPLGEKETATAAALPLWIDFMQHHLKDKSEFNFKQPSNLIPVVLDAENGLPPNEYTLETIEELLIAEQIPTEQDVFEYMQAKQEALQEKQQELHLQDSARAAELRQQERLRREAAQRARNERRRACARQKEHYRRTNNPGTPPICLEQHQPLLATTPGHASTNNTSVENTTGESPVVKRNVIPPRRPTERRERVEIPEQLF